MKSIFLILIFFQAFLTAEFIDSFDDIPPVSKIVSQKPINSTNQLGEEITIDDTEAIIQEIPYKEVKVKDLVGYGEFKVALLVPKKVIKGYAKKISNSILSYLIFRGKDFTFEVFDSYDESEERLLDTILKIKAKGYKFVIAPLTKDGADTLASIERDLLIYIPTINKSEGVNHSGNFYFGGIDYKRQIEKLMPYTNGKLAIFMDMSWLAQRLTSYVEENSYQSYIYTKLIENAKINPKYILTDNTKLQDASIFFNMPLIKTALLASSFSSFDIKPYGLFSTQVNYSPLLLNMIQRKNRENFYIANSIGYVNSKLDDINQNLGNRLKYEWVPYSSSIGIDYIVSNYYGLDQIFNEEMISHQIQYRTKIEKIVGDEFKKTY
jgi:SRSO17 transposase